MIYVCLNGRCGNQLFQYAASRQIANILNDEVCYDVSTIEKLKQQHKNEKGWENSLLRFKVIYDGESCNWKNCLKKMSFKQKIIYLLYKVLMKLPVKNRLEYYERQRKLQKYLQPLGIYYSVQNYYPLCKTKQKNKFVSGTFEDTRWFDDIYRELQEEIVPKKETPFYNIELMKIINERESVCISIRKWTDREMENQSESINNRMVCDKKYYIDAIGIIKKKVKNPVFVIFSDDVEWAKDLLRLEGEFYYEKGNDSVDEKLRLMYNCKHFIMSNSTFCWWAQYLSRNKSKVVISPKNWFVDSEYLENNFRHSLINDNWILL